MAKEAAMLKNFIRNAKQWAGDNRRLIIRVGAVVLVLTLVASIAYHQGRRSVLGPLKPRIATNLLSKLPSAKNKETNNDSKKTTPSKTGISEASSGFYRLNGTVQDITKDHLTLKLTNGSVIVLQIQKELRYYVGRDKKPASELKKDTKVVVTGNVSRDGGFVVSTAQTTK